jgi:hypothetical protein
MQQPSHMHTTHYILPWVACRYEVRVNGALFLEEGDVIWEMWFGLRGFRGLNFMAPKV